jgi:nucleolar pre-ribosomal-associated protein 2
MTLNVEILRDLFWFHSGLDFPLRGKRIVHWSLVAALTELNPDIFLMDPGAKASVSHSDNRPDDLAKHLFDHISSKRLTGSSSDTSNQLVNGSEITTHVGQDDLTAEATIQRIIVPIMCAFARNRNLRGFLERWTEQLRIQSRIALSGMGTFVQNIWESDVLISALVNVFETSLTPGVIGEILRGYVKDVEAQAEHSDLEENAHSDDVIVHAILQSIKTDDTIDGLKPQLLSLWDVYSSRVIKKNPDAVAWMILCRLFSHLWSNHLHESASLQERLLRPLVERAAKDATFVPKDGHFSQIKSATRAAALGFFLTACQCLASIPGSDDLFRRDLPKVLKAMSPAQLESHDLLTAVETFCTAHVSLLDTLGPGIGPETQDNREEAISGLLFTISGMDEEARASVAACLSRSVFEEGSTTLQAAFASACLAALSADNESLHSTSVSYLLQATPLSIAREHREAILDTLVATLHLHLGREESLLSLITHLMDAPNATAKISSNGTALFDLAQRVHDAKLESSSALHNLQLLAQATLTHVLLNKNQAQNNRFLEQYKGQIILTMKQSRECFPSKLAILRGSLLASYKDDALISMDQYLELLSTCLQDETAPAVYVLDAFNEIPLQAHRDDAKGFKATRALLQAWITLKLFKHQPLRQFDKISFEAVPVQLWTPLLVAVTRYGLYAETDWLVHVRSALLCKTISAMDKARILSSIKAAFEPLRLKQRLNMMELCLTIRSANDSVADYQILNALISVAEDKYEDDAEVRAQKLDLLPRLCTLLGDSQNDASFNTLLDGITTVILDKHTFTTQHSIESVLAVLTRVASRNSPLLTAEHAPAIFARLCATTRSILLLHRGRIRGRFHLLIPLLQNLLLCLFIPNGNRGSAHPLWINSTSTSSGRLDSRNAAQFTRLLGTLCSPTQSSVQRLHHSSHFKESKTKKELNDPVKAAREYASQFIYPFLSSYCRFQLYGRLEPRVRDKLTAGIWDAVGLASMDRASLDSMFAGLGKSERDVWKGIWREWERTNGRKELSRVD